MLDLLAAEFQLRHEIELFTHAIGLSWHDAPSSISPSRDTWLWLLQSAAATKQIHELIAEILNHPKGASLQRSIYQLLANGSSTIDARRARLHESLNNKESSQDRIHPASSDSSSTPVGSLEAITSPPSGLGDPQAYLQAIKSATRRVAMIEVAGRQRGTGLLVGPDLLLTAAHVFDSRRWPPTDTTDVIAVFDYVAQPGRSPAEIGTAVRVSEFLCGSLPTKAEADGNVVDWDAVPSAHLDFALLRLEARVPSAPKDRQPRGFYTLHPESYAFRDAPLMFMVQHPLGEYQKFTFIREAPILNALGTRIRYQGNTLHGSSGSPIVDTSGRLVAMHHYSEARVNQAVPVSEIAKAIMASPCAPLFIANSERTISASARSRIMADGDPQRSIAAICSETGTNLGTGFFIAPKTIFTARHILTDVEVGAKYKVYSNGSGFSANVVAVPAELDLAVLETSQASQSWLPFDRSPAIGDRVIAFGLPPGHPAGSSFMAKIEGVADVNRARLLKFRSEKSCEDFTGAPLYNLDRRGVCGVIMAARNVATGFGGLAIAVASVLELLPKVRTVAWDYSLSGRHQSSGNGTTSEQVELLTKEVLAGDTIVIVGDVLDSSSNLNRHAINRYIRHDLSTLADNDLKRIELLKYLRSESPSTSKPYDALAGLPFSTIVSLHPDAQLEKALHSYRTVTLDEDLQLSELAVGKRELYLLGGSVLFGKGLILDQDDRDDLRERYSRLHQGFRQALAMVPILFIGCDFADWTIRRLLWDILSHRTALDGKLFSAASGSTSKPMIPGETTLIDLTPDELLTSLKVATTGRRPIEVHAWVDRMPVHKGFRYLDHFTEDDCGAFFARERECDELLGVVISAQSKISVLCGRSGAGKTSLALAGLQPILHTQTHMRVEYLRSTADPLGMLERALGEITGDWPDYSLAKDPSFVKLRKRLVQVSNPILLVIDQLEEVFVKGGKQTTSDFLAAIRDLAALEWLPIRFLLIVREDFLHELAGSRTSVISTLASIYRLPDFDHAAASDVVRRTAATMGWECEPGFVRAMLEDLSPETILPSHLQIVCHRIQQESMGLKKFSASTYTRLGRASEILRSHVDNALEGLPGAILSQIKIVLGVMVTSRDTKFLLSDAEIAARSGFTCEEVDQRLLELVHKHRLVREIQLDGVRFELAHESLVPTVLEWLDASDHRLRAVQDIVDQDVVVGRRDPGHVISSDRLSLIEAVLDQLNLTEDALALLASSFCVSGSLPALLAVRIDKLSKRRQIESLWNRPAASDSHQFEAVLRSQVSNMLPEYDASDLTDLLRSRVTEAIRTGDDQIFRKLLSFLNLTPALEISVLERVANNEPALRSLVSSARSDLLPSLARHAINLGISKAPSMRLGLRLILEHIDRSAQSADAAVESIAAFFCEAPQSMRRADAVRVVSEFFADGSRPHNPAICGAAICVIARRGSRSLAPYSSLSNREATFVLEALATAQPSQVIAVSAGLLDNFLERDLRHPSLNDLGHLVLLSLSNCSGNVDLVDDWLQHDLTGSRMLARMLSWAMNLREFRKMPAVSKFKIEEAISAFRFGSNLNYRLNEIILSGWDTYLPVDEPTEDELQDLEEALGPDLRTRLLDDLEDLEAELEDLQGIAETEQGHDLAGSLPHDETSESRWLDTDSQVWIEAGLEDPEDDVLDGARGNFAWIDRD